MNDQADLDRQLHEMFRTPGFDLDARPGATAVVLGRVRRARRRRKLQVAAGSLAAVSVCAVVLGLTNLPRNTALVPPAERVTTSQAPAELTMTATGVGPLRLGMSTTEAMATGLLEVGGRVEDSRLPDCLTYTGRQGLLSVRIGAKGVHSLQVYPFIRTPEGLSAGVRYQDLLDAFPASIPQRPASSPGGYRVPVPGADDAWYRFELADGATTVRTRVSALTLENTDPSCS
jgi:hypothetical protein